MFRSFYRILFFVVFSVLASCASTEFLISTPLPTETQSLPTFDMESVTPPPGTMQCNAGVAQENSDSPLATLQKTDRWIGAESPIVTIIFFFDLECPYCAALHPILLQLVDEYPQKLRVVYRPFPAFMVHSKALLAAQALEAAALQNPAAFFSMLNAFYTQQYLWAPMDEVDFSAWLLDTILSLGLDRTAFESAMSDTLLSDQLILQLDADLQAGVTYTPYLLVNGDVYPDIPRDLKTMRSIVELALLESRQFTECPPPLLEEGASYLATLHTEKGDIIIQLMPEVAPQAVNNFLFLANEGWYENIPFYRVIPGSYALSGDPSATGLGNPGYTFDSEINPIVLFDRPGVLAMNNTGAPDTNGSIFFITYQAMPELDGAFTIFGQVIEGLDVLQQLNPRDPVSDENLAEADRLLSVTIQQQ